MSFSYERYERQQRRRGPGAPPTGALGYWLPLGLSLAAATIGFATWIWNERKTSGDGDDSDDYYDDSDPYDDRRDVRVTQNTATTTTATSVLDTREQQSASDGLARGEGGSATQEDTLVSRVSGAMRRTPSPQQLFDGASKRVAAGVAAAGALVGRGLNAIQETDDDYQDHERWSAEADMRGMPGSSAAVSAAAGGSAVSQTTVRTAPSTISGGRRKMVAVVVSAASTSSVWSESLPGQEVETTSILSHLPSEVNHESVDLVILIYAPHLQSYPLASLMSGRNKQPRPESSTASSYSNISTPAAEEDRTLDLDPIATNNSSAKYDSLQLTALGLVAHPTQVLPFTTSTGHVHLLRHLSPSLVYMEESLSGLDGENVKEIEGWVGQIVIVVGGDGLADTETEDEGGSSKPAEQQHGWWKNSNRVGLGKAEIVDSTRFTEDWQRRIFA